MPLRILPGLPQIPLRAVAPKGGNPPPRVRAWSCLILLLALVACAGPRVPAPAAPAPAGAPAAVRLPAIHYTIQVGAFSTVERAAAYAAHLGANGLDAYYFIDTDGLCKVRFARFESKAAARAQAADLQSRGLIEDFYIVQPRPELRHADPREDLRESLVQTARRFIGTPYRWGGESARTGFDCSGLTMTVYRLNGLELPRNSAAQFRAGTPVPREALQRGDLVFFRTGGWGRVSHVGIFTGDNQFIHAPSRGKPIQTASLANGYYDARYVGGRRYY
jgi:cell wall-associated NlpC family hydrolase